MTVMKWISNPDGQDWRTPKQDFQYLNSKFNFSVDCCASADNALLPRYWTDCLNEEWKGERIFCNPPFTKLPKFICEKAREAKLLLMILMLNQLTARYIHNHLPDYLIIPSKRIKFYKGLELSAPTFGTCLLLYTRLPLPELTKDWTVWSMK